MNTIRTFNSNTSTTILNFIRNLVSKTVYNNIKSILSPCCSVSVTFDTFSCASAPGCVYGVKFTNVKISDSSFANKTVQLFITAPEYNWASVATTVTLDSQGKWTGDLYSSFEGCTKPNPFTLTVTVTLLPTDLSVVHRSTLIELSVPNCD
jgi:hypothetical protein